MQVRLQRIVAGATLMLLAIAATGAEGQFLRRRPAPTQPVNTQPAPDQASAAAQPARTWQRSAGQSRGRWPSQCRRRTRPLRSRPHPDRHEHFGRESAKPRLRQGLYRRLPRGLPVNLLCGGPANSRMERRLRDRAVHRPSGRFRSAAADRLFHDEHDVGRSGTEPRLAADKWANLHDQQAFAGRTSSTTASSEPPRVRRRAAARRIPRCLPMRRGKAIARSRKPSSRCPRSKLLGRASRPTSSLSSPSRPGTQPNAAQPGTPNDSNQGRDKPDSENRDKPNSDRPVTR